MASKRKAVSIFSNVLGILLVVGCEPSSSSTEKDIKPTSEKSYMDKKTREKSTNVDAHNQPTETEALELSRKALKEKGYEIDNLEPKEYSEAFLSGQQEHFFQRFNLENKLESRSRSIGRTFWGLKENHWWTYKVVIKRIDDKYECEIYRSK